MSSTVLAAKPVARAEGKKQLFGYLIVTDDTLLHVSPKNIYLKILLVGFVPYMLFGGSIAKRHGLEWAANPPENSRAIPFDSITAVKRGQIRLNKKAGAVVTTDGQEHVFGIPYKAFHKVLSPALAGRQITVEPA